MAGRRSGSNQRHRATPATALLREAGIAFRVHEFDHDSARRGNYGAVAAAALAVDPARVFKTLLVRVDGLAGQGIAVGIVPVDRQLSLRALASAVGGKRAELCEPAVAQRITGYTVGGISPFGQSKALPTVIDDSCALFETVFVSAGRRGLELEIAPGDLTAVLGAGVARIGLQR